MGYTTKKQTWGTHRWWVVHETTEWPHSALVLKCPTKRCADALVTMLESGELDRDLVLLVLVAEEKAHSGLERPRRFALETLLLVISWGGLDRRPPPDWWPDILADWSKGP